MLAPHGLAKIIATFGNIHAYVAADGQLEARWQVDFLERVDLPFSLRLSWDPSRTIAEMTCHRRLTGVFSSVIDNIQERGLQDRIPSFGGCFAFRPQRTGSKLSAHSWGIAIDLNPESNPPGSAGNMNTGLIEIFRQPDFSGEAIGKTRLEIPCIFNFVPDIEFLSQRRHWFDFAASKSLTSRAAASGTPSAWIQEVSF